MTLPARPAAESSGSVCVLLLLGVINALCPSSGSSLAWALEKLTTVSSELSALVAKGA